MSELITRRRAIIAAIMVAALAWWLWPDRNLARLQALQAELQGEAVAALPPEQRQEKFRELRSAMEKLTPLQRQLIEASGRERQQEQMAKYFAMTPAEKKAQLDKDIDRMEEMRKRMQANAGKGKSDKSSGVSGPGAGGPPRGKGPSTPEDRERQRQQRLDRTTPEFRGQMDVYRKDLEQRRQQRGLPPMPPRGGR